MSDSVGVVEGLIAIVFAFALVAGTFYVVGELVAPQPEETIDCVGDCDAVVLASIEVNGILEYETDVTMRFDEPVRGSVLLLSDGEPVGEMLLRDQRLARTTIDGTHYDIVADVDLRGGASSDDPTSGGFAVEAADDASDALSDAAQRVGEVVSGGDA